MRRAWLRPHAALVGLLMLTMVGLPVAAVAKARSVLVLYAFGRLLPANIEFDRAFREAISTTGLPPVSVFDEFLDQPRFANETNARVLARYLRDKYASQPPDIVVVAASEALLFLLQHRTELFPRVPVVHAAVSRSVLDSLASLPADVVGVPIEYDFSGTIEQALRWHPQARRLLIVTGSSTSDRRFEARLRAEAPRFRSRAAVEFLAGLPTDVLLQRLAELPRDSVVFTTGYFEDGDGREFTPRSSAEAMARVASAPIYGPFDTFIGTGVVGGRVPSFADMGRQSAEIVSALLAGVEPGALRLPPVMPNALAVDWRQVRRWRIDENMIPVAARVHFRDPTLLEEHGGIVLAATSVLLLQALLIGWLVFERRRRRLAEQATQKQRFELAHASRLAVVGELSASIAHQINQPLGAILANAEAAELMLESGGDCRDELQRILSDIRQDDLRAGEVIRHLRSLLEKHECERHLFALDAAARDVASLLQAEARRRRIGLEVRLPNTPAWVLGDRVQIQQVMINLILNAMDAVAEATASRRAVVFTLDSDAGSATVTVRDHGHGIPPQDQPRIFDSFFSTKEKGMGLGLAIARSIVETHAGRIWLDPIVGEGAAFCVELPLAVVAEEARAGSP
ncbi:MAG TPA: GHKL domain-containing protein [Candidatus Accumulibacter sp.]|nr:GHKL domain-containing protein [Accumulibacter sp.]HCN69708.1 GHKL domain-containing protein [Accumulibacter sp.]